MLVFVYGTLTDPRRVDAVLGPHRYSFDSRATLEGFHRVEGEYPTLAPGGAVEGRLLAVDEPGLEALDTYEGVDRGLYVRVAVPYSGGDEGGNERGDDARGVDECNRGERAWTYVGDPERLGVANRVAWPGDGPFSRRVRRYVSTAEVAIRPDE